MKDNSQEEQKPVCEVCGSPATRAVQDVAEITNPAKGMFREFKKFGNLHYFCDLHNRPSETHDMRTLDVPIPLKPFKFKEGKSAEKEKEYKALARQLLKPFDYKFLVPEWSQLVDDLFTALYQAYTRGQDEK